MPNVRFIADPKLPRDWADKPYRAGHEAAMSDDEANRWIRRGVAIVVTPAMAAAETRAANAAAAAPADEVTRPEIPEDILDQHHFTRIALARRLTDAPVENVAEADQVILSEIDRRAGQ